MAAKYKVKDSPTILVEEPQIALQLTTPKLGKDNSQISNSTQTLNVLSLFSGCGGYGLRI